jgi:hypothetical protein
MIASTRNSLLALLLGVVAMGACGSDDRAPSLGSGGSSTSGRPSPSSGAAQLPEGGSEQSESGAAAGLAGAVDVDGGAGDSAGAGGAGDAGSGEGNELGGHGTLEPPVDPLCPDDPSAADESELLPLSPGPKLLGGISNDELVLAWTVSVADEVVLHYASRMASSSSFSDEKQRLIPAALSDAVALAGDGLRVVYLSEDRRGFGQLSRSERSADFEPDAGGDFDLLTGDIAQLGEAEAYGDPVLAPNDRTFLYSRFGDDRKKTIFKSDRFSVFAPWPAGTELAVSAELEASPPARVQPTALSADGYSLFVWDGAASTQWLASFSPESGSYASSANLGDLRGATPDATCTRIYYGRASGLQTARFE